SGHSATMPTTAASAITATPPSSARWVAVVAPGRATGGEASKRGGRCRPPRCWRRGLRGQVDAALAADGVVGGADHAAQGLFEVVQQRLLLDHAEGRERQVAEGVAVAAASQEVDGGDVDRVTWHDRAAG